jgi:hypothetical protein
MSAAAPKAASACSVLISVVVPDPLLRVWQVQLIAALGDQIEVLIGGVHHVDAARKAGIGMKHRAALVLVEHADPLTIGGAGVRSDIVVERRLMVGFLGDK